MILLVSTFCSILTFFLVIFVVLFLQQSQSLSVLGRLRHYYSDTKKEPQNAPEKLLIRAYKFVKRVARPFAGLEISKKFDFKLKQAGIPLLGNEFIIGAVLVGVLGCLIMYMMTLNTVAAPVAGVSVPAFFWLWLAFLVKRRKNSFTEQLSDSLTTISDALRAGYSFQQAIDIVAKEMEPPMGTEFDRVITDVAMGVPLEEALAQMNKRVESSDFDLVVTAVLIQREVGGNLAQILDTISDTINERIRMKREIKSITAQGRMSSWILLLLPFATAAFCWIFNRKQMEFFFNQEVGHYAIAFAIIMEIMGFIFIQKIIDIDV